jgi:galactokinase
MDANALKVKLADQEGLDNSDPRIRLVRAPGRVNLIGEHTDYNQGLVMPAAIGLEIWIAYVPTDDGRVQLTLLSNGDQQGFDLLSIPPRGGSWIDYVAATAWAMQSAGMTTYGFRGVLTTDLPMSAGLSSSAALELASLWALSGEIGPGTDALAVARVAQRGENEYVGVRSGLMDQFAVANGVAGHALFLDCRTLDWRPVPLPDDVQLVVCHTGSERKLAESQYNARRQECERAVSVIAAGQPEVRSLRDVDAGLLEHVRDRLDPIAWKRAKHVVMENARVERVEAALRAGDWDSLGKCFTESQTSLRELYEVSSPELDALVEIATATRGVLAARMTGAGFGGCTVNLVDREAVADLVTEVEDRYPSRTGLIPAVFAVEPVAGAGLLV